MPLSNKEIVRVQILTVTANHAGRESERLMVILAA